ncbi:MAG: GMC family oxidoreductase [Lysobacterales bacterium]|jgi:choline dehydrogenase-like flavoprotein
MTRRYDLDDHTVVVVIGSGAGGGTVSNELAQKGIDVVCLEAGNRLTLADVVNDFVAMDQKMTWHDKRLGAPTWLCKTVGGTTMRWSGVTPRFRDFEFGAGSTYGGMGDTNLIDWPLTLEELEPFYDRAEDKMGVSGTHGTPPSFETANFKVLKTGGRRVGYREITSMHSAINSVARDGRPACQEIGFCFSGCAIGAKWSTLYTEIPKAEATGHFELRTGAMALRIEHDDTGKVRSVVYADAAGAVHEQKARAVCVAGNVIETTRLLRNSESPMFPDGLGNSSGHLGRNYMRHTMNLTLAIMPGAVNFQRGPRQCGIILDEQRHDESRGFAGGYVIETVADQPFNIASYLGDWGEVPAEYLENYPNLAGCWITGEDPPEAGNRVTLHPTEKDAYGLPVPVLEYRDHPNTIAMKRHATKQCESIYESLGATRITSRPDAGGGCHNMGVARMSERPADGVTNRWGRVHDIPNLFVGDGSVFSGSGAPNPTLTIVALAIRQAGHIADAMARREL